MTEQEFDHSTDPQAMLAFLRECGRHSERRHQLFAAACFRLLSRLLPDGPRRLGIDTLEEMAEGEATPESSRRAARGTRHAIGGPFGTDPHFVGTMLYRAFASGDAAGHATHAIAGLSEGASERGGGRRPAPRDFRQPIPPDPFHRP